MNWWVVVVVVWVGGLSVGCVVVWDGRRVWIGQVDVWDVAVLRTHRRVCYC